MENSDNPNPYADADHEPPEMSEAEREAKLERYEGTFDDYNEILIQLGFVWLFSPAFPAIAIFAFVNNLVEIRSDANKLCRVFQRPQPKMAEDIGSWESVMEVMAYMGIATNVGLMFFTGNFTKEHTGLQKLWGFVVCEHIFIMIRVVVSHVVPDVPESVQLEIDNEEFLEKKAAGELIAKAYNPENDPYQDPSLVLDQVKHDVWFLGDPSDPMKEASTGIFTDCCCGDKMTHDGHGNSEEVVPESASGLHIPNASDDCLAGGNPDGSSTLGVMPQTADGSGS